MSPEDIVSKLWLFISTAFNNNTYTVYIGLDMGTTGLHWYQIRITGKTTYDILYIIIWL